MRDGNIHNALFALWRQRKCCSCVKDNLPPCEECAAALTAIGALERAPGVLAMSEAIEDSFAAIEGV